MRQFKGLRVECEDMKGNPFVEVLWTREVVGPNSKLGAFVVALGKDTKNWIGKKIRIVKWSERVREVQVV